MSVGECFEKLEKPSRVGRDMVEARKSFYELARSRIKLSTREEHIAFEKAAFGDDWDYSTAVCAITTATETSETNPKKWVIQLDISVDKDAFGEEHKDLIPYAVEHEIYEMWLFARGRYSPQSRKKRHLLARRRQFLMAMKDGKAKKLLKFCKMVATCPSSEFDYAYEKARQKLGRK